MPNPATTLILRADYDLATQYLSTYMQRVVDRAKARGFNVIDLLGADATKSNFLNSLETKDPLLVICASHGDETGFFGQNGEQILEACENDQVMSGRQGIFKSCSVGVQLGPSMVDKTAQWFAGWRADYVFSYDQSAASVAEDEIARPFMECLVQPALTRIDGGGPNSMYVATISKFNREISELWGSPEPWAQDQISYLIHDRDNFMVTGVYMPPAAALNPLVLIGGLVLTHLVFGFP